MTSSSRHQQFSEPNNYTIAAWYHWQHLHAKLFLLFFAQLPKNATKTIKQFALIAVLACDDH